MMITKAIPPATMAMMTTIPNEPPFTADAELYFLPAGHFLFRRRSETGVESKFVTLADVTAAFTQVEQDSGWIPAGVKRHGFNRNGRWFVYWQPAQIVHITLLQDGDQAETLNIPIPATILVGEGRKFHLFASAGEFSPQAPVYRAPFPNLHDDHSICWGNNTPAEAAPENAAQAWKLFFESPFNNHLVGGKSKRYKDDVRKRLCLLNGKRRYPLKDLVPDTRSLDVLVKRMIGGGRD